MWGLHPGFAISPEMRIDLPAENVTVDRASPDFRPGAATYAWPYFLDVDGRTIDMRLVEGPEAESGGCTSLVSRKVGWR